MRESITKKKAKRKGPLQNPAGGRRSKRRKSEVSASSPSDSHSDSEEESGEEDYSYHYDGDTCEAYDCTRPVSDKVSWVSKMYFKWRLFLKNGITWKAARRGCLTSKYFIFQLPTTFRSICLFILWSHQTEEK